MDSWLHLAAHMGSYTSSVQCWCCGARDLRGFDASLWSDRFFTQASECREVKIFLRASKLFRNESVFVSSGCPVKPASSEQSCTRLSTDYPSDCISLQVFQFTDGLKCREQQWVNILFGLKTGLTVVAGMRSSVLWTGKTRPPGWHTGTLANEAPQLREASRPLTICDHRSDFNRRL